MKALAPWLWLAAACMAAAPQLQDWQLDGSSSDLTYNLDEKGLTETAQLRLKSQYRELFLKSLATPWGLQVLGASPAGYGLKPTPDRKPPYAGSIAFPWAGLYMMRNGWDRGALFLSLSCPRRGNGREAEQANFITLDAYGRRLLIANPGESMDPVRKNYFGSSWAQNTVNVDGASQNKIRLAPHGPYDDPLFGRWYTSAHFDFAEATYSAGYGADGKGGAKVGEVTHERQVFFLRDASLWIVVDTMDALSSADHDYAQLWHFSKDVPEISVVCDDKAQKVASREPKASNLFLYHAGLPRVTYKTSYGVGDPKAMADANEIRARGWDNTSAEVSPSVQVDAVWKGRGRQKLVSVLAPSPDASDPISYFENTGRPGAPGFKLIKTDGTEIQFTTALIGAEQLTVQAGTVQGEALLTLKKGDQTRGFFLAPMGGSEFVLIGGEAHVLAPVKAPNGFHWLENPLRPDYQRR